MALALLFCAMSMTVAAAADPPPLASRRVAMEPIPDVEVVDQDGRTLRFRSDLLRGRTVVVNAVYTECTNVCPMMGHAFAALQTALGDRLGKDVLLISISRDPEHDTPARLAAWRKRFGAKPGWVAVTGKKQAIDALLRVLTGDRAQRGGHSEVALLGDDGSGIWLREYGAGDPEQYLRLLERMREARIQSGSDAHVR
jgi:protein SCO1/2